MPRVVLDSDSDDDHNQQNKNNKNKQQQQQQQQQNYNKAKTVETADGTELPAKQNTRVFVDGLVFNEEEPGSLQAQLTEFCSVWKVGKVLEFNKRPGQGFGYLVFRSPNSVEVAVNVLNGKKFQGRHLRVELPKTAAEKQAAYAAGPQARQDAADYTRQVLISDLPKHAQPEILREVFAEYCPALEKHITKIKMTSNNRKSFVTLQGQDQAQELCNFLNGFTVLGRRVEACMAQLPGSSQFAPAQLKSATPSTSTTNTSAAASGGRFGDQNYEEQQQQHEQQNYEPKLKQKDIVGANAKQKYPMPVLIDLQQQQQQQQQQKESGKIRGRDEHQQNEKRPENSASSKSKTGDRFGNLNGPSTVFVANLPLDVTEQRVKSHFTSFNKNAIIKSCELQRVSGAPNGIATVKFALPYDAAQSAENLNGSLLGGQAIEVELDGSGVATLHGDSAKSEKNKKKKDPHREPDEEDLDEFARTQFGVKDRKKFLSKYNNENNNNYDEDEDDDDDYYDGSDEYQSGGAQDDFSFEEVSAAGGGGGSEAAKAKKKISSKGTASSSSSKKKGATTMKKRVTSSKSGKLKRKM